MKTNTTLLAFILLLTMGRLFANEPPAYIEENQIFQLKDKLWEAVRSTNADLFVSCYSIEDRFNTAEVRAANRKQVQKFIEGEIIDMEVLEIPKNKLDEIRKIQNAKPDSSVRYSLVPKKLLQIRCKAKSGLLGWTLLIGNKNDKWYVITCAGRTT